LPAPIKDAVARFMLRMHRQEMRRYRHYMYMEQCYREESGKKDKSSSNNYPTAVAII
jgi:hypothetical protein